MSVAALLCAGPAFAQDKQPPLRTGVDGTFAPHAMAKLGGGLQGFNIELGEALAAKMGRKISIDGAEFSGLIPALKTAYPDAEVSWLCEAGCAPLLQHNARLKQDYEILVAAAKRQRK